MTTQKEMIEQRLNMYYEAEIAILTSQSYSIGTRTLTKANLAEVRQAIKELEAKLARLNGAGRRVRRVIPID